MSVSADPLAPPLKDRLTVSVRIFEAKIMASWEVDDQPIMDVEGEMTKCVAIYFDAKGLNPDNVKYALQNHDFAKFRAIAKNYPIILCGVNCIAMAVSLADYFVEVLKFPFCAWKLNGTSPTIIMRAKKLGYDEGQYLFGEIPKPDSNSIPI